MSDLHTGLRDFIYLDFDRVRSLAAQLDVAEPPGCDGGSCAPRERLLLEVEPAVLSRPGALQIDAQFDFSGWSMEAFRDGQFVRATGMVRLLDFAWMAMALDGLPGVLRRMSKLEIETLKNSEQGQRMSKSQLNQRSQETLAAIEKVEAFKVHELGESIGRLFADLVRVKVRPSSAHAQCILVGSAYARHFYDTPAALSQKHGVQIDAGWTVLGQLNIPRLAGAVQPMTTGNQMEDAFEQIALLMNNAFRLANSPAFPAISLTPLAIYRTI